MKNNKPFGVLLRDDLWQSLIEDLEARSSPNYRARIAKVRKEKKTYSFPEVKKQFILKKYE